MNFYHLGNVGLIQPYDTLLGIIHLLSLFVFSHKLTLFFKLHEDKNLNFLINFILIIILISNLMFLFSFLEINLEFFRLLLNFNCLLGFVIYITNYKSFHNYISSISKNIYIIPIAIFFLLSLSPVTDADSLDYHVGYGLDVINNGSFIPRYDWFHHMLSGHGEFLNLFSLLIGSPNFMHLVQFSSILIVIACYSYIKKKYNSDFNYNLFLFSTPLLLWFVASNKSQLFCSVLYLLSFILLLDLIKKFNLIKMILILLFCAYGVVNKVSFIIPSFFIFLIIIYISIRDKKVSKLFVSGLFVFLIIILPFMIKNIIFYNDPFPPIFENFKQNPDPSILGFKGSISTDNAGFPKLTGYEFIFLPILIVFNSKIALFTALLGVGFLYIIFFYKFNYSKIENKILIFFILFCFFSFAIINNFQPRYYLEIYWMIGLLVMINFNELNKKIRNLFSLILSLEVLVVLFAAVIGVLTLTSGSLSPKLYKKTMLNTAYNYEEVQWLYEYADNNNLVLSEDIRSNSLYKSPWLSRSRFFHGKPEFSIKSVKENKIDFLIFNYPITSTIIQDFVDQCTVKKNNKLKTFYVKTRNIFSDYRKKSYDLILVQNICK